MLLNQHFFFVFFCQCEKYAQESWINTQQVCYTGSQITAKVEQYFNFQTAKETHRASGHAAPRVSVMTLITTVVVETLCVLSSGVTVAALCVSYRC